MYMKTALCARPQSPHTEQRAAGQAAPSECERVFAEEADCELGALRHHEENGDAGHHVVVPRQDLPKRLTLMKHWRTV